MKKQNVLLIAFLLLLHISAFAQKKSVAKPETWIDAAVKQKSAIRTELAKVNLPMKSAWKKVKDDAVPMSADVTGQQKLVLMTTGGEDGYGWDWAVWANAKLVKADGSSVWLDELEPTYAHTTGTGKVLKNKNFNNQALSIGNKKYDHGFLCHAEGVLIFNLDKKYVRFETEVGIDNGSQSGSSYFIIQTVDTKEELNKLVSKYPGEMGLLNTVIPSLDEWLISSDISIEKKVVTSLVSQMKENTYFTDQMKLIENEYEYEIDNQIRSYLMLYEKTLSILRLQNDLSWLNIQSVRLAFADMKKMKTFDATKYQPLMDELEQLVKAGFAGIYQSDEKAISAAQKAISNKRAILLGNPFLDEDKIVATRFNLASKAHTAMAPKLGTQANNWSNQQSTSRTGFDADIIELSNLRGDINIRRVFKPEGSASIADLKKHWNGDKFMFTSLMPDQRWNVFEVNLDGTGFRPLIKTVEPDLEFYDGTFLPDGRIIANSNIGYQGVPCVNGQDPVGNMVLYNPKENNLRRLTFDQDANWNPVIMHNGRVMYTRWEYTDLTHYFSRIVMQMNPDGTENKALFGSGAMFPNSTFDMRPLPGHSSAFVGIISGHHGVARSGRLILFDPMKARKGVEGMLQEIPFKDRPIIPVIKDELVDGVWPQFVKPTPLNDKYFLVAAKLDPQDLWGLYLVDIYDNVTCILKQEEMGFISPIIVRKDITPPVIPDRVKLDDKESTVFIQDVYEGEGLRNIPRGTIKELRIHGYEYAYLMTKSDHYAQGIQSGWDIKRLLGTVPVEEDGSAIFKIPANTPVSIQPIDKDGASVQWMRSWFTGMPGEVVSCIGCHEDQNQIAMPKRVIASQKKPLKLILPEGGVRSFTFDLEVQPILDRACIACHNDNSGLSLIGGKKDEEGYGTSYLKLHPYVHRQGSEADMLVLQPYEYHANTSELVRMLKKGHHNVQLTDEEWRKLYNWIDYNAPDKGTFDAIKYDGFPYQGYDQIERRTELANKYAHGAGVDWKKEIADYAAVLKGKGPIIPVMPKQLDPVKEKEMKVEGWPFDADMRKTLVSALSGNKETTKQLEIGDGVKLNLVRVPAGEFVMGSYRGESDAHPTSKVKIKKSFWMGEIEITNEQYNVLVPEHDSRYTDQFWKDHTRPGYDANLPNQPVIRVSYQDAMKYCEKLSEKLGMKITLPTEAQWEWACRAGSDKDFWYGDLNTDFGRYENLADVQLTKMAVSGIDPQPMSKNNAWYKYFNYLPKEESVDDGNMIQTESKTYAANPFGLHSMHGNIAEWTQSDYLPYPYVEKAKTKTPAEYKVVRGGSYLDRPKYSTAYARKAYYPWQRVFNVGFRVVIED